MANMWTTLAILKSIEYCGGDAAMVGVTYDADMTRLIEEITAQMIDYLDNADIDPAAPPDVLKRACAVQCAYEWKRRKDMGLSSQTFQDGSVNKFTIDEWLPDVKQILERKMEWSI